MNINLVFKFLKAFLGSFYDKGIGSIFWGFLHIFYNEGYRDAFVNYTDQFGAGEWAVAIIFIILIVAALVAIVWLIVFGIMKLIRINKNAVLPQDLVEECANLKKQIIKMSAEKDRILGMKVSDIGNYTGEEGEEGEEGASEEAVKAGESRFYKLTEIDQIYENYVPPVYDDEITLPELCDRFRLFACSRRKLFYDIRIIRLFIAGMSTTRLMILQGISGTGKTSLAHCMGLFLNNPTTIASVQPSWRDRTELFGYFNEFTKRFNETEVLKKMYEATWNKNIYITVLDEMNIARVEYYFAEMLSILEMPSRDEWVVDLVPSGWPNDPKHIDKGRFRLPQNMWFIGTANNDDSTFAISDKVYDRAMPININSKGVPFEAPDTDGVYISFEHLEDMFHKAMEENKVSQENLDKIDMLDDYVIEHFRLAFGNRIVKQLKEFVPAYIACGGTELDGLDYVLCNKILRKFESLNLSYIRDEIDGLILYLSEQFGEDAMGECKDYLQRLKKLF
ncbi:MAG: AAA family ATPase [Clostridia bacterium]|nr:AAA family ATPase [Clostridia bacterium]